jgi:hypothetical protein
MSLAKDSLSEGDDDVAGYLQIQARLMGSAAGAN